MKRYIDGNYFSENKICLNNLDVLEKQVKKIGTNYSGKLVFTVEILVKVYL